MHDIGAYDGGPPEWRGAGNELFYANAGKLMVVEVKTGADTFEGSTLKPLFEIRGAGGAATFDATGDGQRFLIAVPIQEATSTPDHRRIKLGRRLEAMKS